MMPPDGVWRIDGSLFSEVPRGSEILGTPYPTCA
jgi:hypothetical protein